MNEELDKLAEQIYDYICANRKDNLNKDGTMGNPRKISCEYSKLLDPSKNFYRSMAQFHLTNE